MKALLVSNAAIGHLDPLLAVGRILMADGHEVMGLSSNHLRGRIEGIGATFRGFASAGALDIKNASDAAKRLDDDEKGIAPADTLRGTQSMLIINESGLFSLILRSDKPQAKKFKKWVTSEVLPSIRRIGFIHSGRRPSLYSPVQPELGSNRSWVLFGAIRTRHSHLGSLRANRVPDEGEHGGWG